ncbi:MAG: tyrosine-type recombinase/integrase [Mycolicibacterium sp.]
MTQIRNRRAGVEDRWTKTVHRKQPDGTTIAETVPSKVHGKGMRWRARYVDKHGREHSKSFARKLDAKQWLDKQVSDQVTGTWTDPKLSGQTFGALAEKWIATKATKAPKTFAGYRSLLDVVVLPRWGDVPLRDIAFEDIQEWVSGLSVSGSTRFEGKGLSASRVIQAYQVVKQVLQFAVRAKRLPSNPAEDVELPEKHESEQTYLTHEQLHRLAVASGRFRTLVFMLGYCGLRFGEAAALKVGDVNLETRRIRVSRSVTNVAGRGLIEGPTKNKTARTVPVPKFLAALLETEIQGKGKDALVFPSRRGADRWMTLGELRWVFDVAVQTVQDAALAQRQAESEDGGEAVTPEFPALVPHQLRHSCASLAIAGGANIKVLQRLMGHKTATMTLDKYGHLFPDDLGRIADAFDSAADALRTEPPLRAVPLDRKGG